MWPIGARYLTHDHLGSTRGVFDDSKASLGAFEYTPYGMPFAFDGPADMTRGEGNCRGWLFGWG